MDVDLEWSFDKNFATSEKTMRTMSLNHLPDSVIVKIGEYLTPRFRDLIAFSHTNSRIFQIFCAQNYIWELMMDGSDRIGFFERSEEAENNGMDPETAKDAFFERTRFDRNWRLNKFNTLFTYDVPADDEKDDYYLLAYHASYSDFFVHACYRCNLKIWRITWVDLAADICTVQVGVLSKPIFSKPERDRVYISAASNSVLIFSLKDFIIHHDVTRIGICSIFAVDISDANNLRVMWQKSIRSTCRWEVNVANFQIYRLEVRMDGSKCLKVLSAATGQELATWTHDALNPEGKVNLSFLPRRLRSDFLPTLVHCLGRGRLRSSDTFYCCRHKILGLLL